MSLNIEVFVLLLAIALVIMGLVVSLVVPLLRKHLHNRAEAKRRARMPRLYRCENNGVIAVVRAGDFESARQSATGSLVIVPNSMIFCSDSHYYPVNINDKRTGNLEDYRRLTADCVVETRGNLFVPFSSFVWGKEWQYDKFSRITMSAAMDLVHGRKAEVKKSSFQKTDWVLIIALVVSVVLAIFVGSMDIREETGMMHFISLSLLWIFAGTFAAIILGRLRRRN